MSAIMTLRLYKEMNARLEHLAKATKRKSFLGREASRAYIKISEWRIAEIEAALQEVKAGDFASDKEVASVARKWKVKAR